MAYQNRCWWCDSPIETPYFIPKVNTVRYDRNYTIKSFKWDNRHIFDCPGCGLAYFVFLVKSEIISAGQYKSLVEIMSDSLIKKTDTSTDLDRTEMFYPRVAADRNDIQKIGMSKWRDSFGFNEQLKLYGQIAQKNKFFVRKIKGQPEKQLISLNNRWNGRIKRLARVHGPKFTIAIIDRNSFEVTDSALTASYFKF